METNLTDLQTLQFFAEKNIKKKNLRDFFAIRLYDIPLEEGIFNLSISFFLIDQINTCKHH